ncbi:MAG: histidine phosphatase family protein [Anaerolineae bacterium]|nr:histidine phosphatase family protein [Anaerolineae bacterium]
MTRLLLVRHGKTDWNLEGRYQGQADQPLNEQGRSQARQLAEHLAGQTFEAIYSSDLHRAYETASLLAGGTGLGVQLEPRLREINQGKWEGMLVGDIAATYPTEWEMLQRDPIHTRPPGGETAAELANRIWAAVDEIAQRHIDGPVLIVSHGLALAAVLCRARRLPLAEIFNLVPDNTHPIEVDWSDSNTAAQKDQLKSL